MNHTKTSVPQFHTVPEGNMYDYLWELNKDHLDDLAIMYQGKNITYRHLFSQIDKLADRFYADGIRKGDVVMIISLNTPETIYTVYALNKIGAISSLELVTQTPDNLRNAIRQVKPKIIVVLNLFVKGFWDVLSEFTGKIVCISPVEFLPSPIRKLIHKKLKITSELPKNAVTYSRFCLGPTEKHSVPGDFSAHAVYLSTSGSTGVPKKVILSNSNLNAVAMYCDTERLNLKRGGKMLSISPPFLSVGISLSIHFPLCKGIVLVLCTNPSPESSADMFAKYRPNYYLGALEHLLKITEHKKLQNQDFHFLHCCMLGGESISLETKNQINNFLLSHNAPHGMFIGYAMTECSGFGSAEVSLTARKGCVGLPHPSVTVKIRNLDDNSVCAPGKTGEIMLASPSVMVGYLDNPEETAATIEVDENGRRWVHTGDLGYLNQDGEIFIIGRLKRIFTTMDENTGLTYKMFPQQIESELNKIPFITRSAVVVQEDPIKMHIPVAFVSLDKHTEQWEQKTIATLSDVLPSYAIPVQFIAVDELPLLSSGKIDYKSLESRLQ